MNSFVFEAEITPGMGVEEFCELATAVEDAGFDRLGVSDVALWPDTYQLQVLAAQSTKNIMIGSMVTNPYTRNPAVHASALATLNDASDGRAFFGVGVGAGLEEIGINPTRPVATLRETITVIRSLLNGEETFFQGSVFNFNTSGLVVPRKGMVPVAIGTRSPQVMRLAGEIADIALVGARNLSPSSVANYKQWLSEGADLVGRDVSEVKIAPRVTLCVSEDSELAHSSVRRYAAHYLEIVGENGPEVEQVRKNEIFKALSRSRGWYFDHNRFDDPELESLVDDELVKEFAIVGTSGEVAEQLEEVLNLGFSQISCNLAAVRRTGSSMAEGLLETIKGSGLAIELLRNNR
ncbi:MAG: hypothetical protein CL425_03085 [Acidimicrobiaceae bacterium]|nr:hypothetical protein [Acidimicrobiaceae bacterium]